MIFFCTAIDSGSSPRVRGTGVLENVSEGTNRFIPAGAGNGFTRLKTCCYQPVHPRGCGERFS